MGWEDMFHGVLFIIMTSGLVYALPSFFGLIAFAALVVLPRFPSGAANNAILRIIMATT